MKVDKTVFWEYAFSDCVDNLVRARLGEYLVAKALSITDTPYSSWESYDIETENGIKIEVKTSGYVQTWPQKQLTKPSFGIGKKGGWNEEKQDYGKEKERQANVYVFCLHNEKTKETDPLNTDNWIFYVIPTLLINEKLGDQKNVGIYTIEKTLGCKSLKFDEIKNAIEALNLKYQFNKLNKSKN